MMSTRWVLLAFLAVVGMAGCGNGTDDADTSGDTTPGDDDDDDTVGDDDDDDTSSADAFQLIGDALPSALLSISCTTASDVWMVGPDQGTGPAVYHYDGAAWSTRDTGTSGDFWWVWNDGQGSLWIIGEGSRLVKHDIAAGTFTEEVIGNPAYTLFGIWGSSPTDVFAVAADVSGAAPGEVYHYDGTAWTSIYTLPNAPVSGNLRQPFKVWGTSSSDVWVVGTNALATHWDGTAFTDHVVPMNASSTLFTVHGTSSSDVWAVGGFGNAMVMHWDGTTWTDDSPPPAAIAPGFTGVFADDTLGPVAAGNNGAIWRRDAEGVWAPDPRTPATTWNFHAVWVDPDDGIWACGGDLVNLDYGVIVYGGDGSIATVDGT
jgi:hypothetical protein